jgi:F-type H+-transporting ATPase subunit delta
MIAQRYAQALFALADEGKKLDQVAGDLATLRAMLETSEDMGRVIRSPLLSRDDAAKAMAALAKKASLSELSANFLGVVARNRRLFALPGMISVYLSELSRRRGEVAAEVITAAPLSAKQEAAITAALKQAVGAKVTVSVKLDKSLIGGLIVRVGSKLIDSSIKSKLNRLQLAMKGVS